MSTNQSYLGTNGTKPFHYQRFNLNEKVMYRNGLPVVGTPFSTTSDQRVCFNMLQALNFLDKGDHGIPLAGYPIHFVLAFDLTSTQEASHDFIHPELTKWSISFQFHSSSFLEHFWVTTLKFYSQENEVQLFTLTMKEQSQKSQLLHIRLMDNFEIKYLMKNVFIWRTSFAECLQLIVFHDCQTIALWGLMPQYQHHRVIIGYWFVIIEKEKLLNSSEYPKLRVPKYEPKLKALRNLCIYVGYFFYIKHKSIYAVYEWWWFITICYPYDVIQNNNFRVF